MNVLITGANFMNKGAEAMLVTAAAELSQRVSGLQPMVRTDSPSTAQRLQQEGVTPFTLPRGTLAQRSLALACAAGMRVGALPRRWGRAHSSVFRRWAEIDAIVDAGGFSFGDHAQHPLRQWQSFQAPIALRKPLVFLPQAHGPFRRRLVAWAARDTLRHAALVFARDDDSVAHLVTSHILPADRIRRAADTAFLFRGAVPARGTEVLQGAGGANDGRKIVAIVPNRQVYKRCPGRNEDNAHIAMLAHVARTFARAEGCRVVFVPHAIQRNAPTRDDRALCKAAAHKAGGGDRIVAITGDYTAAELKAALGHADLVVASRYHAAIAALSQHVPAVTIGWSHKYDALMASVGLDAYAVQGANATIDDIDAVVTAAWRDRTAMRRILSDRVPRLVNSSATCMDIVADTLGSLVP